MLYLGQLCKAVTCDSQLLATCQEEPVPEAGRLEEVSELIKTYLEMEVEVTPA